jgi:hypothetical protein
MRPQSAAAHLRVWLPLMYILQYHTVHSQLYDGFLLPLSQRPAGTKQSPPTNEHQSDEVIQAGVRLATPPPPGPLPRGSCYPVNTATYACGRFRTAPGRCYQLFNGGSGASWAQARSTCESRNGGRLVVYESPAQQLEVEDYFFWQVS